MGTEPEHEQDRVLATFMRDGKIVQIPRAHGKRRVILDLLAQEFDLGVRYTEKEVNEILARFHPDTAAWRRYLVDEEFMEREAGVYWRAGGTWEV
ncbi:MAG: hypothetical protein QOC92_3670 [Acidimicrobiaceae bacterium]